MKLRIKLVSSDEYLKGYYALCSLKEMRKMVHETVRGRKDREAIRKAEQKFNGALWILILLCIGFILIY